MRNFIQGAGFGLIVSAMFSPIVILFVTIYASAGAKAFWFCFFSMLLVFALIALGVYLAEIKAPNTQHSIRNPDK